MWSTDLTGTVYDDGSAVRVPPRVVLRPGPKVSSATGRESVGRWVEGPVGEPSSLGHPEFVGDE